MNDTKETEAQFWKRQCAELQRQLDEQAKQEPVAWIEKDELELELLGHKGELYGSLVYKKPLLDEVKPEYQEPMENPVALYRHPINLPAMIEQAVREERELCAELADGMTIYTGRDVADAIRARGETK